MSIYFMLNMFCVQTKHAMPGAGWRLNGRKQKG